MPTRRKLCKNMVGNGKKCWLPAFSAFPTMFSANAFNLDKSKFLLSVKLLMVLFSIDQEWHSTQGSNQAIEEKLLAGGHSHWAWSAHILIL